MKKLKILFVEDLVTDVEIACREIKREAIAFDYQVVDTEAEFRKELKDFKPDLIISDYSMPSFDGMSALHIVRALPDYLPFIILTGSMNEETAVACMKAGADDYVIKEKIRRLPFAVREVLTIEQTRQDKDNALKRLSESEEELAVIYRNAPVIMMLVDKDRKVKKVNGFAADFIGRPAAEMIELRCGEALRCLHHLDDPRGCGFGEVCKQCKIREAVLNTFAKENEHLMEEATLPMLIDGKEKEFTFLFSTNLLNLKSKPHVLVTIQDISKRKQAEENIKKNLHEKNILLQELYHRTKNNMQIIASMMKLQIRQIEDETVTILFWDMITKIKSMALVHEKLYQSKNLSEINLKEYIPDLTSQIARSYYLDYKRISLTFDLQSIFIKIDSAIPLGLILSELITNIYKHAFSDNRKGKILVQSYMKKEEIHLVIQDDGVGLPEKMDLRKIDSMGLHTIFTLAENQLKGTIKYETKNGLRWHIEFKDNHYKKRV